MTKRLSPERIAELKQWTAKLTGSEVNELFGHIEAIEAELARTVKRLVLDVAGAQDARKELAEAKAEIARLKELRTRDAAEVVAWLAREAPELFERCKAALEKT